MSRPIEDYALISDRFSAALVARDGAMDWLAFPAFDSPACLAALLGNRDHGSWQIHPRGEYQTKRNYVEGTVVLETVFSTSWGKCKLIDCMVLGEKHPTLIRAVEGIEGEVDLHLDLTIRFDYGSIVPWVRRNDDYSGIHAIGGPEALVLYSPEKLMGVGLSTQSDFRVTKGEKKFFILRWHYSHEEMPPPLEDPEFHLQETILHWRQWSNQFQYEGFDRKRVKRSLLTLKALTYEPTGAIVAAPTTSLPETLGGERNWDYRFAWIRDSSFTLFALIKAGYKDEAMRWNQWLLRAVAGTPSQVNLMYGIRGERRLNEFILDWLPGYENSKPVRVGNAAYDQLQLDVFGEMLAASHLGRINGIPTDENTWLVEQHMVDYVSKNWHFPDEGIWEVRGPRQHFTHSKLMAWVAMKYAVEAVREFGLPGDADHWEKVRDKIHADICSNGFNPKLNAFTQSYGSNQLDASILMMGHANFLPHDDPRMVGTVEAIQKHLTEDGHVFRYRAEEDIDGLPGKEGSFIACSFWLVDNLRMMGRVDEALELYKHIRSVSNDLGLFAEEYSPGQKRLVGNFPQAFSHIAQAVSAMGFEPNCKIEEDSQ